MVKQHKNFQIIHTNDLELNHINIVRLGGEPEENGFNVGQAFRKPIQELYRFLFHPSRPVYWLTKQDIFREVYEVTGNHISDRYKDEMKGLAKGADIPLDWVHWAHILPTITEHDGYSKKLFRNPKKLISHRKDVHGTSCSVIAATNTATKDGETWTYRGLDWMRWLDAQKSPLVLVYEFSEHNQNVSVLFSYAGFIGCIAGLNNQGLSYAEQGWADSDRETIDGIPFPFIARDSLTYSSNLEGAVDIFERSRRTCDFVHLIADGKSKQAKLLLADSVEMKEFGLGETVEADYDLGPMKFPGIKDLIYSGMYDHVLYEILAARHGQLDCDEMMKIAMDAATNDAVQAVITRIPQEGSTEVWVANAQGRGIFPFGKRKGIAPHRPYLHFRLDDLLNGSTDLEKVYPPEYDPLTPEEKTVMMGVPEGRVYPHSIN
jgi:isopenicillin-N N-acyltransferase like protein